MAMQTRSVRVDSNVLALAERVFAENGTTFSEFVRTSLESIARSGRLPRHVEAEPVQVGDSVLAFEAFADSVTSGCPADGSDGVGPTYATAPAKELLAEALGARYGR